MTGILKTDGTMAATNGATAITLTSASWTAANVKGGDQIAIEGSTRVYFLNSVDYDAQTAEIWPAYDGSTASGLTYAVSPNGIGWGRVVDLNFNLAKLLDIVDGARGTDGADAGLDYAFDATTTAAAPDDGAMRLNNATLSSVTAAYFANSDANGDKADYLDTLDGFTLYLIDKADRSNFAIYTIGTVSGSTYRTMTLTYVAHGGSFDDGADLLVGLGGAAGATGATGAAGADGADGADGDSAYVYIAYASDASGTGFTTTFSSSLDYIAVKATTSPIASPSASDFTGLWKNYKGATGATGATGSAGADGTDGTDGADGADGALWYTGSADPSGGTGQNGDFYLQTGTGSTGVLGDVWEKASGSWSITGNIRGASGSGTGDMLISTYDPTGVSGDAFDMDNMVEGADAKVMTAAERTAIANALDKTGDTMTGALTIAPASGWSQLTLKKPASGQASAILSTTNGSARWQLSLASAGAESGSDAGSDFILDSYDDSGSWIGGALTITRSDLSANFGGTLSEMGERVYSGNNPVPLGAGTTGILTASKGGTGNSSWSGGELVYGNDGTSMSQLALGTSGQVLRVNSGESAPEWADNAAANVTLADSDNIYTATNVEAGLAEAKRALAGVNTKTGTSYTFVLADAGKVIEANNASAVTFTVPPNSSVAFPVGTRIDLTQYGAGQLTVAAGSGVTIRSADGNLKLSSQYSGASLYKRATNEWVLVGDLTS